MSTICEVFVCVLLGLIWLEHVATKFAIKDLTAGYGRGERGPGF